MATKWTSTHAPNRYGTLFVTQYGGQLGHMVWKQSLGEAKECLADVINIHSQLTNQIN